MDSKQPESVNALIDEFVRSHHYLPEKAERVTDREELPLRLQQRIHALPEGAIWRAWREGYRMWFVIARRVPEVHAEISGPVLEMSFHDWDGACAATGAWLRRMDGTWWLHRVCCDPLDNHAGAQVERVPGNTDGSSLRFP
jgi:hypothetical protein